jgi:uncharacterized protein (TIGR00369 family)
LGDNRLSNLKVIRKQNNSSDCIICGLSNSAGLHAHFYVLEDFSLGSVIVFRPEHQSYLNRVHGGMIAALIDESIGRAVQCLDDQIWGVTFELSVSYLKPVPYGTPLFCVGKIARNSRIFTGSGYIADPDGTILAKGTAKYLRLTPEQICGRPLDHNDWFLASAPNKIETIPVISDFFTKISDI